MFDNKEKFLKTHTFPERGEPGHTQVTPDWTKQWTGHQAEEQLQGFKFKGQGWYITDTDTILAIRAYGEVFYFHVWNNPSIKQDFEYVMGLPVYRL